jgi:hypothetical protein
MNKNIKHNTDIEKRKAFNFLRSYYDVLEEINDDKDKLDYLLAILKKQFEGIEPELNSIPKLCYIGQKHSIDSSRKGWEDKVGYEPPTLTIGGSQGGIGHPTEGNTQPPSGYSVMTTEGVTPPPYLQEQEKEQVEEEEQVEVKENRTNILGDLERKKFYNSNIQEIEHIRTLTNLSIEECVNLHYDALQAMKSVFG